MRKRFKKFHGISASIDPADTKLYRTLLPDLFDMPERPLVSLTITEFVHVAAWPLLMSYREGAIALKSRVKDGEGWFFLDIPVTKGIAAMTYRHMGFPKRRVELIEFAPVKGVWQGGVTEDGRNLFSVEFSPDGEYPRFEHDRPPCTHPVPPLEEAHLVGPLRVGSKSRKAWLQVKRVVKETPALPGTARVEVAEGEEWARLVNGERSWPGVYFQFWGDASVHCRSLK